MNPRKVLLWAGLVLLIGGSWLAWRIANPPLSAEKQIAQNLESMGKAVSGKNARGVTGWLNDDFRWESHSKREVHSQLAGFFFNSDAVNLQLSNVQIKVNGERATASGRFLLSYQVSPSTPLETRTGSFRSQWVQKDGEWRIQSAESTNLTATF
jgi:hypothetical protein